MEFLLFDLFLTAFFSLLFAFLLARLFSPSPATSSSSRDAAVVISDEAPSASRSEEDLARESGGELQEEKIIEVDEDADKEARSIGRTDVFGTDVVEVEKEKEKLDHHGLAQKDDGFEVEAPSDCEVGDGKAAQSFGLTLLQDRNSVPEEQEEEEGSSEVEITATDDSCEVEGLIDKMSKEIGVSSEKDCLLKEQEHGLMVESLGSVTVKEEEVSHEALVNCEIANEKDEEHNLCEVEGPIGKIDTEELIVSEEISALVMESKNETDPLESGEPKEEIQEEEGNLVEDEGPMSGIAQLGEVVEEDYKEKGKETACIEEEGWEGIERTDTEKQFAVAAGYATSLCGTDALAKLSSEVQLQLYGLHKVATEGPCYESHPMALRTSARAKWHAWQKLGNMNPETAMEQYMNVLSKSVPNWSEQPIVDFAHNKSDQLTIESGSCIEGPAAFGSASPEKGTESPASIQ